MSKYGYEYAFLISLKNVHAKNILLSNLKSLNTA